MLPKLASLFAAGVVIVKTSDGASDKNVVKIKFSFYSSNFGNNFDNYLDWFRQWRKSYKNNISFLVVK